ncbi:hypothetical protein CLV43_102291 [Umezawaea tangerina]|uniref:DNA-binding MarR family transcriptional regulator n=2 Tax=Umezawaea tangerina TaxID=84725 RepID=A0A2T0TGB3_9PSEU|nr:hypothetical protein CLV43_102291 [Umezawaea tangerina]
MQPPASQPIGFWSIRAGEAIRTRIRAALQEIDVTQSEWWVLHQLSRGPDGVDRTTVVDTVGPNDTPAVIESTIETAIAKGWIHAEGGRLRLSAVGTERFEAAVEVQKVLQDERMQGISVEDYETTITVLQRTIVNVGGDAWHW